MRLAVPPNTVRQARNSCLPDGLARESVIAFMALHDDGSIWRFVQEKLIAN